MFTFNDLNESFTSCSQTGHLSMSHFKHFARFRLFTIFSRASTNIPCHSRPTNRDSLSSVSLTKQIQFVMHRQINDSHTLFSYLHDKSSSSFSSAFSRISRGRSMRNSSICLIIVRAMSL